MHEIEFLHVREYYLSELSRSLVEVQVQVEHRFRPLITVGRWLRFERDA